MSVTFTTDEARALYELIDQLSGCNPESVFAHDGTDSLDNAIDRACAKLYVVAGRASCVPKNLLEALHQEEQ